MTSEEVDSALGSTALGTSLFAVGRVVRNIVGFVVNLLLTNLLGPYYYGLYTYCQTILRFSMNITDSGTDKALMRFLPEFSDTARRETTLGLSVISMTIVSLAVAVFIYAAAPFISGLTFDAPIFTKILRIFAFILPFSSFVRLIQNLFRALDIPQYQLGISEFLEPLSRLVAAGVAVAFSFSVAGATVALLVATVLLFLIVVSLYASRLDLRPALKADTSYAKRFFSYSIPLTLNSAGWFITNRIDIIMVGFFLSGADVGYYRIAALLGGLVSLPLNGLNQIFPPRASKLYAEEKFGALSEFYSVVTRWALALTIPIVVGLIVYRTEILALFGDEFTAAQLVLIVLVISGLSNAIAGPCGMLLMMSDHHYIAMVNNWGLGLLNLVLNFFFIQEFGIVGAAIATAVSISVFNALKIVEVFYLEGLQPYSTTFYKPTLAAAICYLGMIAVEPITEILPSRLVIFGVILGGILGTSVYFVSLLALGLEDVDIRLLRSFLPRTKTSN